MANSTEFETWEDLYCKVIELLPGGTLENDIDGQLVIYTGLKVDKKDDSSLIDINSKG